MKNVWKKASATALALAMTVGVTAGCGGGGSKGDENANNFLQVYVWDAGYGTKWLDEELKAFVAEDWVQEKYPEITYDLDYNDDQSFAAGRIAAEKSNTIDLFFAPSLTGLEKYSLDLTEVVYGQKVPGEEVLFKDKLLDYMEDAGAYYAEDATEPVYYSVPYGAGMVGWIYNVTLFDALGLKVPNTTKEFYALCETVKGWEGKKADYPYTYTIRSSQIDYAGRMNYLWWAQYDGVKGVDNYFNAIAADGTRNSTKIFEEAKGRVKSAEVFKQLYSTSNGYFDASCVQDSFMDGQSKFIMGNGLIQGNGEWFSMEMAELAEAFKAQGYDYEIGMMRYPVISDIIDKTPSIKTDEMLSAVIKDIDEGKDAATDTSVTAADYAIVKEARSIIVCPDSMGTDAVVPNYAAAKDAAADFLRFLATNKANSIMAKNTFGGMLPFEFELKKDDATLHNELQTNYKNTYRIQLDVSNIIHAENVTTPSGKYYPMVEYGTFTPWAQKYAAFGTVFMQKPDLTAEEMIEESDEYWLANNAERFKKALSSAGLA